MVHTHIQINGDMVYLYASDGVWYQYNSTQQPLGEGSMGTVFLGCACENHHDHVAIKLVNERLSKVPSIRERARKEASFAFRHENLVEMIGYCDDGTKQGPMFIISRLVPGKTLDEFVKLFALVPDRVNRIVRCIFPVLDALHFIHSKGIIHLDVKPSNIMVEESRNIRLMDLGIAFTQDNLDITSPGLLGTAGYAAPEQYLTPGQTRLDIDASTDVYETGATLYELLSGKKPYGQGTAHLQPILDVPTPLMNVINRSLAKDKAYRYSTALEFKQDLEKALLAPKPVLPNWAWLAIAGGGALLIIILLIVFLC